MACPVDNKTIRKRWSTRFLDIEPNESRVVDVVLNQNWAQVNVPIATRGTVDDERTSQTVGILSFRPSAPGSVTCEMAKKGGP